jgi:hypothetical protein
MPLGWRRDSRPEITLSLAVRRCPPSQAAAGISWPACQNANPVAPTARRQTAGPPRRHFIHFHITI